MDDKQLVQAAAHEIIHLRRELESAHAQLSIVRTFQAALMGPPGPQPMSPDIVPELMKRSAESLGHRAAPPSEPPNDSGSPYVSETNVLGKVNVIWYPYAVLVRSDVAEKVLQEVRLGGDKPSLGVGRLVALEDAAARYQARPAA